MARSLYTCTQRHQYSFWLLWLQTDIHPAQERVRYPNTAECYCPKVFGKTMVRYPRIPLSWSYQLINVVKTSWQLLSECSKGYSKSNCRSNIKHSCSWYNISASCGLSHPPSLDGNIIWITSLYLCYNVYIRYHTNLLDNVTLDMPLLALKFCPTVRLTTWNIMDVSLYLLDFYTMIEHGELSASLGCSFRSCCLDRRSIILPF